MLRKWIDIWLAWLEQFRHLVVPDKDRDNGYGPCPACSGSGKLRNLVRARKVKQMRSKVPAAERNRVCNICGGKGQVITRETTKN